MSRTHVWLAWFETEEQLCDYVEGRQNDHGDGFCQFGDAFLLDIEEDCAEGIWSEETDKINELFSDYARESEDVRAIAKHFWGKKLNRPFNSFIMYTEFDVLTTIKVKSDTRDDGYVEYLGFVDNIY